MIAITRKISPRFNECEITHIERVPIDLETARAQHAQYVQALQTLGCQVIELEEEPALPDSVFVEDTAFILNECAVITRPGANSRKPEVESIAQVLSAYLPLIRITDPASVDGGDVLVMGKNIYVGMSTRSNQSALGQLQIALDQYGYKIFGAQMRGCLHLKTAITKVDDETVLINPNWVDVSHFKQFNWIEVDAREPFAANCLPVGGKIIYPEAFPATREKLEKAGHAVHPITVDELAKAEGAVTCCSLILPNS